MKWVIATQDEYDRAGITVPSGARRFNIDTPNGEQEVILQHIELQTMSDEDYERVCNIIPQGNFVGSATLEYLLPVEVEDGATGI